MEAEFGRYVPEGVSVHEARLPLRRVIEEELIKMCERVEEAAKLLADAEVDIIAYGCTTGSLIRGKGFDIELEERIRKATGIPAVATARAVLDALRIKGLKKIAIATPYTEEINEKEKEFLSNNGFEVCAIRGLGLVKNLEIGMQEPHVAYRLGRELMIKHPEADGLFISCTNFRTLEIISILSHEIGKPVITSNQATLWRVLQETNINSMKKLLS
jgi:maleate isomerase